MKCEGCQNNEAIYVRVRYGSNGERNEVCDKCGQTSGNALADAHCPVGGYFDENLADKDHRKGQWIRSKEHKREVMRRLGLEEAGSNRNSVTGKVVPFIADPVRRRKFCLDNFGK